MKKKLSEALVSLMISLFTFKANYSEPYKRNVNT